MFATVHIIAPQVALAAIHSTAHDLNGSAWDFIIVGGGTAGSVIANRLSEDPDIRVLVIEAGGTNTGPTATAIDIPFLVSGTSTGTMFDWNYTTTPQAGLDNRTLDYPRGHVLGGSSSTNFMAYTRGSFQEYDRLAAVSGDEGWSWSKIVPYFFKGERHVPSADNHNTTGQFDPRWHGTGPLLTSLPGNPTPIDDRILTTIQELSSSEFVFNEEMNSGKTLGLGWLQSTIGNSKRSSAATAYLDSAVENRKNLDVLLNTRVTRLISSGLDDNRRPILNEVEVAQDTKFPRLVLKARIEVIICAGSIGTPQVLMLSGVGDKDILEPLNISVLAHVPQIGRELQDHPFVTLQWRVNSTNTLDSIANNQTALAIALREYEQTGQGLFADNPIANQIGFFRLSDGPHGFNNSDPSAGHLSPHFELAFANGFVGTTQTPPSSGNFISIAVIGVSPTSRGSVTLNSSSPFAQPLINPAFLSTDIDNTLMIEAIKSAKRFFDAPIWEGYIIEPASGSPNFMDDKDIAAYVRRWSTTIRHPVATARMIDVRSGNGVVHSDLTLRNVSRVRVVDASIIAMIYALAERAADIIKDTIAKRRGV
ncbi:aryl-alcohol oxidase-like protein [Irpex lacteus]|nr:aryl-alcohol oxidase-like protein [Irpex lacteus]